MGKPKSLTFKNYAAVLVIIALIVVVTGYLILERVHNYYYEQMENESNRLASSYVINVQDAMTSKDMINGLLNDKLITAGRIIANFKNDNSGEVLARIAENLGINEIYTYNSNGEIVYSYSGKYIGWKAYEGHPVYKFMQSGNESFVEDIRKDTESNLFYKYAYFRASDGSFIQIGVLANSIERFINSFEMQKILDKMQNDQFVSGICFFDNDLKAMAGRNNTISINTLSPDEKNAIENDKVYKGVIKVNGVKFYEIMIPVFVSNQKLGTLVMTHDLKSTETMITNISYIALIALLIIYALLFVAVLLSFNNNKKLSNFAYFDILTRLPNIRYFEEKINSEKSNDQDNKALLLINYKKFKLVNTTFGHHYGEKIIKELSKRLSKLCSNDDIQLFHMSNDRFVLYVKKYKNRAELEDVCQKVILMQKESLKSKTIGGNIGIVEMNDYRGRADTLLKYASIAANYVEEDEPFGYCFFNKNMEDKLKREEEIEAELSKVIDEAEGTNFYMLYQPILNLKTGRIYGFEALARLSSERLGFVSPAEFIPIAEKTHLIVPLGKIALRLACQFLKKLEISGFSDIKVTVNISAIQLHRDDFLPELMRIIEESQIKASNLGIEITESIFSDNYEMFNEKLAVLKKLGMPVAIDDFGTGYSSLARERELNVNCLKIDKSFIDKLATIEDEEALTGDIISMAHKLGDIVVAEGVELLQQKEYLEQNDCDCMQGFLFSKPLPQTAALAILEKQNVIDTV